MSIMTPLTFTPVTSAPSNASSQQRKQTQHQNRRKTLENLVKQLPADATGMYLMGLDLFKGRPLLLTGAMITGALVLLLVRIGLKSSAGIVVTSFVSYLLWVYAIGNGPFQHLLDYLQFQEVSGVGTFIIAAWTTMITIAANYGWIK